MTHGPPKLARDLETGERAGVRPKERERRPLEKTYRVKTGDSQEPVGATCVPFRIWSGNATQAAVPGNRWGAG